MGNQKFVCLVQGRASEICNFEFLQNSRTIVISLSWDFELPDKKVSNFHFFLPGSSWAEGRNFLLKKAQECVPDFQYVIFFDGDLKIIKGNFSKFLDFLDTYKPDLGLPLSNQIMESFRYIERSSIQTQVSFDQIMQAYSRKIVSDKICLPFDTKFDQVSWWYSCEINQYLTLRYYGDNILQFNELIIENSHHSNPVDQVFTNSRYKGGLTRNGKAKCKSYIEKSFGKQKFMIGTLFHPNFLLKPSEVNIKSLLKDRKIKSYSLKRELKLGYTFFGLPYKFVLKVVFRKHYPTPRVVKMVYEQNVDGVR